MNYLSNAFSLQMVPEGGTINIKNMGGLEKFSQNYNKLNIGMACIGHADMASLLSSSIGIEIPVNRVSITLLPGDKLWVVQVTGGRLPEGCTSLPESLQVAVMLVEVTADLRPYEHDIRSGSINGSILNTAGMLAASIGAEVAPMQDHKGNLVVEISANGFYGTMWDD